MRIFIRDDLVPLINRKAHQDNRNFTDMVNVLLSRILWNEPEYLFKGKHYKVEEELFARNKIIEGELEI